MIILWEHFCINLEGIDDWHVEDWQSTFCWSFPCWPPKIDNRRSPLHMHCQRLTDCRSFDRTILPHYLRAKHGVATSLMPHVSGDLHQFYIDLEQAGLDPVHGLRIEPHSLIRVINCKFDSPRFNSTCPRLHINFKTYLYILIATFWHFTHFGLGVIKRWLLLKKIAAESSISILYSWILSHQSRWVDLKSTGPPVRSGRHGRAAER